MWTHMCLISQVLFHMILIQSLFSCCCVVFFVYLYYIVKCKISCWNIVIMIKITVKLVYLWSKASFVLVFLVEMLSGTVCALISCSVRLTWHFLPRGPEKQTQTYQVLPFNRKNTTPYFILHLINKIMAGKHRKVLLLNCAGIQEVIVQMSLSFCFERMDMFGELTVENITAVASLHWFVFPFP